MQNLTSEYNKVLTQ